VSAATAPPSTPAIRHAWGETSFYLIDPWGNPLAVVAAGTEFREGRVS
jgi:hypothetical protein